MTTPSHRPIDHAYWLPWTRLFRGFRIAADPRKLLLAAVGITLIWGGDRLIAQLPFAPEGWPIAAPPWDAERPSLLIGWGTATANFWQSPLDESLRLAERILSPAEPLAAVGGLGFRSPARWTTLAVVWTRLLWTLAVWGLVGGAIARLAAVEFARDERIPLRTAIGFAARRFPSLFGAVLLPITGALVLWGLCALAGTCGRIPYAGPWITGLAWGLLLLVAFLLLLVGLATAAGWPLMIAAVATEGSDAFDGFSRSFSYLYGRPFSFVFYTLVALAFGVLATAAVDTAAVATATAAARTAATGLGTEEVVALHAASPAYFRSTGAFPFGGPPAEAASHVVAAWLGLVATVAAGFAASYFWTAAVIVYFLLRRADDATHFDDVYLGETADDGDELLAIAGIASTGQPVVERPHQPTVEPPVAAGEV